MILEHIGEHRNTRSTRNTLEYKEHKELQGILGIQGIQGIPLEEQLLTIGLILVLQALTQGIQGKITGYTIQLQNDATRNTYRMTKDDTGHDISSFLQGLFKR